MTQKAVDMNQIKQVQQLSQDGVPKKEIARRTGISVKTVRKYLRKLEGVLLTDHGEKAVAPIADKELAAVVYNNDDTLIRSKRFDVLVVSIRPGASLQFERRPIALPFK